MSDNKEESPAYFPSFIELIGIMAIIFVIAAGCCELGKNSARREVHYEQSR